MPIVEVVLPMGRTLPVAVSEKIKILGSYLGYHDPRRIWVAVRGELTQSDVAYAQVMVKPCDLNHENFPAFCDNVARSLREGLGVSVEVILPGDGVVWAPTEEGAKTYTD